VGSVIGLVPFFGFERSRCDPDPSVVDVFALVGAVTMPEPEPVPAPAVPETDNDFFYANQIRATTGYRPDLQALLRASNKIVVGIGATAVGQLAHRGGLAPAEHLGLLATEFPGDHGGFANEAPAFAEKLREVLAR
jgi:hypothetical protein